MWHVAFHRYVGVVKSGALLLYLGALTLGCTRTVRITEFEKGTLFGLERVTFDDGAGEYDGRRCGPSQLVYATNKDGNFEIYIKPTTGRETTRKTTSPSWDGQPVATRDCKRIAFASNREGSANLYVISGEEASAALKIGEGTNPDFSWDGMKLYYERFLFGEASSSIWVYDFGTNQHSQLVQGFDPAISPDGSLLAFSKVNASSGLAELWLLNLTNRQEQQLLGTPGVSWVKPVWSADGLRLLLTAMNERVSAVPGIDVNRYRSSDLAVVNKDGTQLTKLTDNRTMDVGQAWDEAGFIYFTSNRDKSMDIWRFSPRFVTMSAIGVTTPPPVAAAPAQPVPPPPSPSGPTYKTGQDGSVVGTTFE